MICNICGREIEGQGNNPFPISESDDDRCCDYCNKAYVIPARLIMMHRVVKEPEIGDDIIIFKLSGEKTADYVLRKGTIKKIDDSGQLHGTWGGLAVIPEKDVFAIVN